MRTLFTVPTDAFSSADLRRLVFVDGLFTTTQEFVFLHLEELCITHLTLDSNSNHVLSLSRFPALRSLHIELLKDDDLVPSFFLPFLPQLDLLSFGTVDLNEDDPAIAFLLSAPNCLFTADLDELVPTDGMLEFDYTQAVHLCLSKYPAYRCEELDFTPNNILYIADALLAFAKRLRSRSFPNLASLYLPADYDPCGSTFGSYRNKTKLRSFLATCASLSIEVVFEESPHPYYNSLISTEFAIRSRKRKERQAQEALELEWRGDL
jgi:hypothetical protein